MIRFLNRIVIVLLFAIGLFPFQALAQTPALVQTWGSGGTGTSFSGQSVSNVTSGNKVYVHTYCGSGATCSVTVVGNQGDTTYTQIKSQALNTDGDNTALWCGTPSSTGKDQITISTGSSAGLFFIATEVSNGSCSTDGINSSNTTCSSGCTSGNITTTTANDFIIGTYANTNSAITLTAGSGWSNINCMHNSGALASCTGTAITAVESQIPVAGTYAATFTASGSDETAIMIVAFCPSGGCSGVTVHTMPPLVALIFVPEQFIWRRRNAS